MSRVSVSRGDAFAWKAGVIGLLAAVAVNFVAYVTGCSAPGPKLPGDSLADSRLQRDTVPLVSVYEMSAGSECDRSRIADTAVATFPEIVGMSPWIETWTVDRCGELVHYKITYTPTPARGGTDIAVSPLDDERDDVSASR